MKLAQSSYTFRTHSQPIQKGGFCRFRRVSRPHKELSGKSYYRIGARYYDADLGMWVSVDPMRQFASPYLYAGNGMNPVNMIDVSGEWGGGVDVKVGGLGNRNSNSESFSLRASYDPSKPFFSAWSWSLSNTTSKTDARSQNSRGAFATFGVSVLGNNSTNVKQLEGAGKSTGTSVGLIEADACYDISQSLDDKGHTTGVVEVSIGIPVGDGVSVGVERHKELPTNTTTILSSENDND